VLSCRNSRTAAASRRAPPAHGRTTERALLPCSLRAPARAPVCRRAGQRRPLAGWLGRQRRGGWRALKGIIQAPVQGEHVHRAQVALPCARQAPLLRGAGPAWFFATRVRRAARARLGRRAGLGARGLRRRAAGAPRPCTAQLRSSTILQRLWRRAACASAPPTVQARGGPAHAPCGATQRRCASCARRRRIAVTPRGCAGAPAAAPASP